jgi:myo-inositol-1(or 4)-monophosphatase
MNPMLTIAVKAARRAGNIITRGARDLSRLTIHAKGPSDYVTEVDRQSEEAIVETLLSAYPDYGFLCEEGTAADVNPDSEYKWIIDPLDGTTNFLHGMPQYCVSIALSHQNAVTHGVVFDPVRNDLFTAARGSGAFMNDHRIRVSRRNGLKGALIGTGFPFRPEQDADAYVKTMRALFLETAGLRRPGAAALDLAYVAAGFYDGFFETGLKPWDIAAGSLLIQEAGGIVTDYQGGADYIFGGDVIAATPKVMGGLAEAVRG